MLTIAPALSRNDEYLNKLQQVSEHLPLAVLLLS